MLCPEKKFRSACVKPAWHPKYYCENSCCTWLMVWDLPEYHLVICPIVLTTEFLFKAVWVYRHKFHCLPTSSSFSCSSHFRFFCLLLSSFSAGSVCMPTHEVQLIWWRCSDMKWCSCKKIPPYSPLLLDGETNCCLICYKHSAIVMVQRPL